MTTTSLLLLFLVPAAVLLVGIALYNRLVALSRRCDQAGADVDVQLKLRHDLVPSLVETVKGYAGHERSTLDAVIRARAAAVEAPTVAARARAEGMLGAALGRLIMVAEAYPDLKASGRFGALQAELADIEQTIAAARRCLNAATTEYNTTREQFPGSIVASLFTFPHRDIAAVRREERAMIEAAPAVRF
ncbi:MAG: LemA family protein [Hyphomicrobiaceae bacterium]|nr:LemA family protein [Hyphomicrobiaceae bacterium]